MSVAVALETVQGIEGIANEPLSMRTDIQTIFIQNLGVVALEMIEAADVHRSSNESAPAGDLPEDRN